MCALACQTQTRLGHARQASVITSYCETLEGEHFPQMQRTDLAKLQCLASAQCILKKAKWLAHPKQDQPIQVSTAQRQDSRGADPVREALERGVREHKRQRGRAQHNAVRVQLQQHTQPQAQLPRQQACAATYTDTCHCFSSSVLQPCRFSTEHAVRAQASPGRQNILLRTLAERLVQRAIGSACPHTELHTAKKAKRYDCIPARLHCESAPQTTRRRACPIPSLDLRIGTQRTQGVPGLQRAGRERARRSARHAPVQVRVPQVIYGAAGAAQQHRARAEQRQQARVRQIPWRRRQRDGPEARPGQQPGA